MIKMHDEQMTLGDLIKALERFAKLYPDMLVCYDFCGFVPTRLNSYRGYYEQLALGYSDTREDTKVTDLLKNCRDAVGNIFEGYKGGGYTMREDTPVWIANRSESDGTGLIGATDVGGIGYALVLHTKCLE